MTIAEQLALEEVIHNKDMAVRDAKRLVTEAFQREMGVAASEQRTERYMLKSTVGNLTMLDPTGGRILKPVQNGMLTGPAGDLKVCQILQFVRQVLNGTMLFWMAMDICSYPSPSEGPIM